MPDGPSTPEIPQVSQAESRPAGAVQTPEAAARLTPTQASESFLKRNFDLLTGAGLAGLSTYIAANGAILPAVVIGIVGGWQLGGYITHGQK